MRCLLVFILLSAFPIHELHAFYSQSRGRLHLHKSFAVQDDDDDDDDITNESKKKSFWPDFPRIQKGTAPKQVMSSTFNRVVTLWAPDQTAARGIAPARRGRKRRKIASVLLAATMAFTWRHRATVTEAVSQPTAMEQPSKPVDLKKTTMATYDKKSRESSVSRRSEIAGLASTVSQARTIGETIKAKGDSAVASFEENISPFQVVTGSGVLLTAASAGTIIGQKLSLDMSSAFVDDADSEEDDGDEPEDDPFEDDFIEQIAAEPSSRFGFHELERKVAIATSQRRIQELTQTFANVTRSTISSLKTSHRSHIPHTSWAYIAPSDGKVSTGTLVSSWSSEDSSKPSPNKDFVTEAFLNRTLADAVRREYVAKHPGERTMSSKSSDPRANSWVHHALKQSEKRLRQSLLGEKVDYFDFEKAAAALNDIDKAMAKMEASIDDANEFAFLDDTTSILQKDGVTTNVSIPAEGELDGTDSAGSMALEDEDEEEKSVASNSSLSQENGEELSWLSDTDIQSAAEDLDAFLLDVEAVTNASEVALAQEDKEEDVMVPNSEVVESIKNETQEVVTLEEDMETMSGVMANASLADLSENSTSSNSLNTESTSTDSSFVNGTSLQPDESNVTQSASNSSLTGVSREHYSGNASSAVTDTDESTVTESNFTSDTYVVGDAADESETKTAEALEEFKEAFQFKPGEMEHLVESNATLEELILAKSVNTTEEEEEPPKPELSLIRSRKPNSEEEPLDSSETDAPGTPGSSLALVRTADDTKDSIADDHGSSETISSGDIDTVVDDIDEDIVPDNSMITQSMTTAGESDTLSSVTENLFSDISSEKEDEDVTDRTRAVDVSLRRSDNFPETTVPRNGVATIAQDPDESEDDNDVNLLYDLLPEQDAAVVASVMEGDLQVQKDSSMLDALSLESGTLEPPVVVESSARTIRQDEEEINQDSRGTLNTASAESLERNTTSNKASEPAGWGVFPKLARRFMGSKRNNNEQVGETVLRLVVFVIDECTKNTEPLLNDLYNRLPWRERKKNETDFDLSILEGKQIVYLKSRDDAEFRIWLVWVFLLGFVLGIVEDKL